MARSIVHCVLRRRGTKCYAPPTNLSWVLSLYRHDGACDAENNIVRDLNSSSCIVKFSTVPSINISPNSNLEKLSNEFQVSQMDRVCRIVNGVGDLEELEANLSQSGVTATPQLIAEVIRRCSDEAVGRRVLTFFNWCRRQPGCSPSDEIFNHVIDIFGRKKDLRAMEILLADMRAESRQIDVKTFAHVTERFVRAGRDQEAVGFFKRLEEFKCQKDEGVLRIVVCALCEKGFARKAEILVKHMRKKLPPDEFIYNTLVRGWCVVGRANEARRVMNDMRTLGFSPGLIAYNSLLHCICKSFAQKNPFWLLHEANDLMAEMEDNCISPNQITFNTLIAYLCKIRKTEDAYSKFLRMEKCGCSPNSVTYVLLIKTMYLTARLEDGDKMLDKMIEAGFKPDAKTYYNFIAVLCGIEKVNHALRLLTRMKEDGCEANSKVFDLLILKLSRSGHFDEAQHIWNEATQNGITLDSSPDLLDPRTTKIYKPVRKEKQQQENNDKKVMKHAKLQFVKHKAKGKVKRIAG